MIKKLVKARLGKLVQKIKICGNYFLLLSYFNNVANKKERNRFLNGRGLFVSTSMFRLSAHACIANRIWIFASTFFLNFGNTSIELFCAQPFLLPSRHNNKWTKSLIIVVVLAKKIFPTHKDISIYSGTNNTCTCHCTLGYKAELDLKNTEIEQPKDIEKGTNFINL
jgi:hypothetical protein